MKKSLIIIFLLVFISAAKLTISQDTSIAKYLPLNVGNIWIYNDQTGYPCSQCHITSKYIITGIVQIEGRTYFKIAVSSVYHEPNCIGNCYNNTSRPYWTMMINIDSLSGNVYSGVNCSNGMRYPIDSLRASLGDSLSVCMGSDVRREVCSDTSSQFVFNRWRESKSFRIAHASGAEGSTYIKNIGLYTYAWGESTYWWAEVLKGCVIDGVVYGDTSFPVGVSQISTEVPKSFSLYQNYPNPFNPSTAIKFDIPVGNGRDRSVLLKIYNSLGQEVSILVNEQLQPGTYEIEWDGRDFASGVYYYSLQAGEYLEAKKMLMIK